MFFFSWYGDHRDLHSFPTRRSSDLRWDRCCERSSSRPPAATPASPARSEEHTSGLQSRGHLVCRLLLEKKKISSATVRGSAVIAVPTTFCFSFRKSFGSVCLLFCNT